jgi:hypothetical protein
MFSGGDVLFCIPFLLQCCLLLNILVTNLTFYIIIIIIFPNPFGP